MKGLNFLNKPYPFNDDLKHNAKIIFIISVGILGFLLLFQPIDVSSLSNKEILYLVTGLAASTFLSLSLNLLILPSFLPNLFRNLHWKIWKEILWNLWILITITGINFLFYTKLFGLLELDFNTIVSFVLIAVLPVTVLITINQDRLLRANLKSANKLNQKLTENKNIDEKIVFFESEYKKDDLSIKVNSLLFIKSASNYIEVYYTDKGVIKNQMVRCSLLKAEENLKEYDFIIRCHRTYIINTKHIDKVEGNSQGYKLYFDKVDFPVTVSQKYIVDFQNKI
ncbi:MAG: LytTR family transcriptional regulator [Saprospiraceae bacterium]|nr:LytTR family transcriptional regulator [Saprospiraceae bacterium]